MTSSEPLITSTANPRVKRVVELHRRRSRRERGEHLVEGPVLVAEAVRAGIVHTVYGTAEGLAAGLTELADAPRTLAEVDLVEVSPHVLQKLADATTPRGIVAVARTPTASLGEVVGRGLVAVLDAVADPGNAGTIIRTADAAGAAGIVLSTGSVDAFAPKTIRAAAGSTYHLPIATDVSLVEIADACRSVGQPLLGLTADGARSVFELDQLPVAPALVLGNEAHGLAAETLDLLDGTVAIPIRGRAESLNVAAAAAVALYAAAGPDDHTPTSPGAPSATVHPGQLV